MTKRTWLLREALYALFHDWKTLLLAFALGSILGLLSSFLWPPYYKASRMVYVGLNPYRAYSDSPFLALAKPRYSNIDNYHYWQMNQLQTALFLDETIEAVLETLRAQDPYWQSVDSTELRHMFSVEWRTAGAWYWIVRHRSAEKAEQALLAWQTQGLDRIAQAVQASQTAIFTDQKLIELSREILLRRLRLQSLRYSMERLQEWQQEARSLPQEQPLSPALHWQLESLTNAYAKNTPLWQKLLDEQPPPTAPLHQTLPWVERILAEYHSEIETLPQEIRALEEQEADLKKQYHQANEQSLGLSPTLVIKSSGKVNVKEIRPTSHLMLIGGVLAVLVALFLQLLRLSLPSHSDEGE